MVPVSVLAASGEAVKLYALIDRHANESGEAWPYRSTLATEMGCSRDKVDRLLRELAEIGAIEVVAQYDAAGDRSANLYRVAARMRPPSRGDADTHPHARGDGGRGTAATGGRAGAAYRNESQKEREPRNETSSSPAGDGVDDAAESFEHFWREYPRRNGKREGKAKALAQWRRLSIDDRRAAWRGARHYATLCNTPNAQRAADAWRWLRDRRWPDWQEPAIPNGRAEKPDNVGSFFARLTGRPNGQVEPNAVVELVEASG